MIGAIITLVIIVVLLEIYRAIIATLQYFESKNMTYVMSSDSSQTYLSAIKSQKTKKPILPSRRNGKPMQELPNDEPISDVDDGINLLSMDPDEGYEAIMHTMGVEE